MSFEDWKKEFYPKDASALKRVTNITRLRHSLKKWIGLRVVNLRKHRCYLDADSNIGYAGRFQLLINGNSCALCHRFAHHGSFNCQDCPLGKCDYEFSTFMSSGNPEPMILALQMALCKAEREHANKIGNNRKSCL